MRRLAILLLMSCISLPAIAARKVTVRELERILIEARGKSDGRVAGRLDDLELSDPMSGAKLARWEAAMPGEKSRRVLALLADKSAFLDAPMPSGSEATTPEMEAQLQMVTLAIQYVRSVLPKLPNFTATRETRRYREMKPVGPNGEERMLPHEPMHAAGNAVETLLYRNGEETVDSPEIARKGSGDAERGLTTHGVFGPILAIVLADAIKRAR